MKPQLWFNGFYVLVGGLGPFTIRDAYDGDKSDRPVIEATMDRAQLDGHKWI